MDVLKMARELDCKIMKLVFKRNKLEIEMAFLLAEMDDKRLFAPLGYESVSAYAEDRFEQSSAKTKRLLGMARNLVDLPSMTEFALAGEVGWTKLTIVASVATPEDEEHWIEAVQKLTRRELEAEIRGGEVVPSMSFELSQENKADIDSAIEAVRRENPSLTIGQALGMICRGFIAGTTSSSSTKQNHAQLVVTTCRKCETATRNTRDGSIEVKPERVAEVACDAELVEMLEGTVELTRTIKPKVARFIDARDERRCRFPGCKNRLFIDRHHEGGWRQVGHDPRSVLLLCGEHHRARHDDHFTIEGDANKELTFRLADGTQVTRVTFHELDKN